MEVRSEFDEFSEIKESMEKVGVGGFDDRLDEINLNLSEELTHSQSAYSSYHLEGKIDFEGVESVTTWLTEGRIVLCYVQANGRRKRKKGVGCGSRRHENYMSGRCGIRIWDPGIKRAFQDLTLRAR